jgi:hypothetical protein
MNVRAGPWVVTCLLLVGLAFAVWPGPVRAAGARPRPAPPPALSGSAERATASVALAHLPRPSGAPEQADPLPSREAIFWAYDFGTKDYYRVQATLRHASDLCRIYVENGRSVPLAAVSRLAELFEDQAYPRLRNRLGHEPEPGIDGERAVTLLLLDVRDPYGHGTAPFTYYAGYFDPTNQFRQADLDAAGAPGNRRSNEREMIYLDVDPTPPGSDALRQTLAHEFAHLITWNYDPDEDTWLSEGLSELAVHIAGLGHPAEHVAGFLAAPESSLVAWSGQAADYGRTYLFMLYLYEQAERAGAAGGIDATAWPRRLVEDPGHGLASLAATWPLDRPMAETWRDWAVALHLDDDSLGDGRYGFASPELGAGAFPFAAATSHPGFPVLDERHALPPWSVRADRLVGLRGDVDLVVAADGAACAAAVALPTFVRQPGSATVLPACTDGGRALGWTFTTAVGGGRPVALLAIVANAGEVPLSVDVSALPPAGSFGWAPPPLLLPHLRR